MGETWRVADYVRGEKRLMRQECKSHGYEREKNFRQARTSDSANVPSYYTSDPHNQISGHVSMKHNESEAARSAGGPRKIGMLMRRS